jgi:hypothetical protein
MTAFEYFPVRSADRDVLARVLGDLGKVLVATSQGDIVCKDKIPKLLRRHLSAGMHEAKYLFHVFSHDGSQALVYIFCQSDSDSCAVTAERIAMFPGYLCAGHAVATSSQLKNSIRDAVR